MSNPIFQISDYVINNVSLIEIARIPVWLLKKQVFFLVRDFHLESKNNSDKVSFLLLKWRM